MFDSILRHFNTDVEENTKNNRVTVSNIHTRNLMLDLKRMWQTSTIETYMFIKVTGSKLILHGFFVPDFYYTLEAILDNPKCSSNKREVKAILTGLKTNTWYRDYFKPRVKIFNYDKLNQLHYKLLAPQLEAMRVYEDKVVSSHLNGYLLAADVGTGKSLMGLALAVLLDANPCIIVCPKYIIDSVWGDAIALQFKNTKRVYKSNTDMVLDNSYSYYIFHYEALEKAVEFAKKYKLYKPVIILDESHNLNDIKSNRTQKYLELCKLTGSNNIIHESGTAVKAMGAE